MEKIMKTLTNETQKAMTPQQALTRLKEGNQRFVESHQTKRDYPQQVVETSIGQFPFAIVLGCVDSRVPPELIFDLGIGDVFSARIAGNFVNPDILGSMEFATKVVGSKLILVLGHTMCGAIQGAYQDVELGNLTGLLDKLKPAVEAAKESSSSDGDPSIDAIAKMNVRLTIKNIKKESPILKELWENGDIAIEGAMYDVATGKVTFLD
jgi:carbonic anhydrase